MKEYTIQLVIRMESHNPKDGPLNWDWETLLDMPKAEQNQEGFVSVSAVNEVVDH